MPRKGDADVATRSPLSTDLRTTPMNEADALRFRPAVRGDLPAIVRLLADDPLGAKRETHTDPLPGSYLEAFDAIDRARQRGCHMVQLTSDTLRPDAIRFYETLGFVASHEGMKLHLPRPGDEVR